MENHWKKHKNVWTDTINNVKKEGDVVRDSFLFRTFILYN